ncbi:MAG: Bax inhibitor-1 family protein [Zoogloeaceae bacterium]|nr:Bax inhibitor-1 family protein [Zoogloeaceae bacterium]
MSKFLLSMDAAQEAGDITRSRFVIKAYAYLSGALLAFAVLSLVLHYSGFGVQMMVLLGGSSVSWLVLLGCFMVVGWLASSVAEKAKSNAAQVSALGCYVLAWAIMFSPLFFLAAHTPGAILTAVFATLLLVGGLTWTAIGSKKDFSFLGGILRISGLVAIGAIVASVIFGFSLGIWFSALMIVFAGGCVLYDTSVILRYYPLDRPAGAALHLFASIALLLWYVLRFVIQFAGDD